MRSGLLITILLGALFLVIISANSNVSALCLHGSCGKNPPSHNAGDKELHNVRVVIVQVNVINEVVGISHLTDNIPVVHVVNQIQTLAIPSNANTPPSTFGAQFYGLVATALAMLGAAAGFGFYAPMYDVPANVTGSGGGTSSEGTPPDKVRRPGYKPTP